MENLDLNKVCRTCLSSSGMMECIFESSKTFCAGVALIDMIKSRFKVEIQKNDDLPKNICLACITKVITAYNFQQECDKSHKTLKNYIKQKSGEDNETLIENTEENISNEMTDIITASDENEFSIYRCPSCTLCFMDINDLNNHSKCHLNKYSCEVCNVEFSKKEILRKHMVTHSEVRNYLCSSCGKTFLRSSDLIVHNRIHTGEKPYACDKCPNRYKTSFELNEHLKTHSETNTSYLCTICGKNLLTRNGLYVHMKAHQGEKKHRCSVCGEMFANLGLLNTHTKVHTQNKSHKCSFENCNKYFYTKIALLVHERTHTNEKPFKCPHCERAFSDSSNLSMHKRTHSGIKPNQCSVCHKFYGNSQSLKKHFRLHTGERPYSCNICNERFISNSILNTHIKVKHMEKQHECVICHKKFHLITVLRKHMRIHSGERPYTCHECGMSFGQSSGLHQHLRSHKQELFMDPDDPVAASVMRETGGIIFGSIVPRYI